MKRFIFFLISSLCLLSCVQNNNKSVLNNKTEVVKKYKALELVDTIISIYPNLYVNDIQKEKFLEFLFLELDKKLTEDNSFLSEIPMQFSQMLKISEDKYILKFECGEYTTSDARLKSETSKTAINYAIFTEVDTKLASTLEDKAIYILTGTYKGNVNGKLRLPSGTLFDYNSSCFKSSFEEYGSICLGGFLFTNINLIKIE